MSCSVKIEPSKSILEKLFSYTEEVFSDGARIYIGGFIWLPETWSARPAVRKRIREHGIAFAGGVFVASKTGVEYPVISFSRLGGYLIHRLVWVWHNGPIPIGMRIDHINRNQFDNRIENLRCVTDLQNRSNRSRRKTAPSEYVGVSFRKEIKQRPWVATISVNGVSKKLGCYATSEEAAVVRDRAVFEKYGEFGNYNFPHLLNVGIINAP